MKANDALRFECVYVPIDLRTVTEVSMLCSLRLVYICRLALLP